MARLIDLRVARLERRAPPVNDLTKLTDEKLHVRLMASLREKIADPASSPEQVSRARRMLNLPWSRRCSEWSMDDLLFFRDEAHRDD
jgi:hypothetical protein